jgi:hypothetical protein
VYARQSPRFPNLVRVYPDFAIICPGSITILSCLRHPNPVCHLRVSPLHCRLLSHVIILVAPAPFRPHLPLSALFRPRCHPPSSRAVILANSLPPLNHHARAILISPVDVYPTLAVVCHACDTMTSSTVCHLNVICLVMSSFSSRSRHPNLTYCCLCFSNLTGIHPLLCIILANLLLLAGAIQSCLSSSALASPYLATVIPLLTHLPGINRLRLLYLPYNTSKLNV